MNNNINNDCCVSTHLIARKIYGIFSGFGWERHSEEIKRQHSIKAWHEKMSRLMRGQDSMERTSQSGSRWSREVENVRRLLWAGGRGQEIEKGENRTLEGYYPLPAT